MERARSFNQLEFELDTPDVAPDREGVYSCNMDAAAVAPERQAQSALTQDALVQALERMLGVPLALHVHDNRSTMVSFRRFPQRIDLRVHRMFLRAGDGTLEALAEYVRSGSDRAGRVLDGFVERNRSAIRAQGRSKALVARGQVFDLQALFDDLNDRHFGGSVVAGIGWGRASTAAGRRSIRLGAYFEKTRTILIHRSLDAPNVARTLVEFVLYHEMLHQAVPAQFTAAGRRILHPPEFRRRERLFPQYPEARRQERRHLEMLLTPQRQTPSSEAGGDEP